MTKVSENSVSAGALSRAKANGRYYNGWVYGTKAEADQARAARRGAQPGRGGRGAGRGGRSSTLQRATGPTAGWVTRDVAVYTWEPVVSAGDTLTRHYLNLDLFPGGDNGTVFTGLSDVVEEYEILGVRLQVQFPANQTVARFAAAVVDNDVSGDKTLTQVSRVSGAIISHDHDLIDGWFTANLGSLKRVQLSSQDDYTTLRFYLSFEQLRGDTTPCTFKVHVTYRAPGTVGPVHTL